jgi:hypothetical protein
MQGIGSRASRAQRDQKDAMRRAGGMVRSEVRHPANADGHCLNHGATCGGKPVGSRSEIAEDVPLNFLD